MLTSGSGAGFGKKQAGYQQAERDHGCNYESRQVGTGQISQVANQKRSDKIASISGHQHDKNNDGARAVRGFMKLNGNSKERGALKVGEDAKGSHRQEDNHRVIK